MEWKENEKYPTYEVSSLGDIRHKKNKIIRKLRLDKYGYLRVNFMHQGKNKTFMAHKLVADFFLDGCPKGLTINHIDGNKANNAILNLEFVTPEFNTTHAFKLGLVGTCEPCSIGGKTFYSKREAERQTGIPRKLIRYKLKQG